MPLVFMGKKFVTTNIKQFNMTTSSATKNTLNPKYQQQTRLKSEPEYKRKFVSNFSFQTYPFFVRKCFFLSMSNFLSSGFAIVLASQKMWKPVLFLFVLFCLFCLFKILFFCFCSFLFEFVP